MIEQLQLARLRRKVGDRVGDGHAGLADARAHGRGQTQLVAEHPRLIDHADDGDVARVAVHGDLDLVGGRVGDPPVDAVAERAVGMVLRRAVALQAAAAEQLVEAAEPAAPRSSARLTIAGWTGPLTGERQASGTSPRLAFQRPMPRVGRTTNRKCPVIDLDDLDALAQAGLERAFDDAVAGGRAADVARPQVS